MNLYQHSQQNNWEMGIKIKKNTDLELYNKIYAEVMLIIQNSQKANISNGNGFCIRCGANLIINPEKPLCSNCYKSWEEYSNLEYKENFCHICGKESDTTYGKPVCYNCYKKLNK